MGGLRIHLLGTFRALAGMDNSMVRFPTRKAKSLLACMALKRGRRLGRGQLAGEIWPDVVEERAHRSLNTEFWRLRVALRNSGVEPDDVFIADFDSIGLSNARTVWVDADVFAGATARISREHVADAALANALTEAVGLYQGDLMEGVYDEWCLVHREAYRARLVAALEWLLRARMEEQRWDQAIVIGARLVEMDPLLEHVHRALMRCHFIRGNRAAAIRQFTICAAALQRDLNVRPMEETQRTYEAILSHQSRLPTISGDAELKLPASTADKVDLALSSIDSARSLIAEVGTTLRASEA